MDYLFRYTVYANVDGSQWPKFGKDLERRSSYPAKKVMEIAVSHLYDEVLPLVRDIDADAEAVVRVWKGSEYIGEYHSITSRWYK